MERLKDVAKKFDSKLKKIKVFATDVDGVLTDGRLWYQGQEMGWNRYFHAHDGSGLKYLIDAGIKVGVISGGDSRGLRNRLEYLKLDFFYLGSDDKRQGYLDLKKRFNVTDEEILYIGDDFYDIPILKKVGFAVSVPSASEEVREVVDWVTNKDAGHGAVREAVDVLRHAAGIIPRIPDFDE
jgi:3-deoxy-D-manno-octulosonate 8-phosphate phosphatase (KDO 8-P phosphatase)